MAALEGEILWSRSKYRLRDLLNKYRDEFPVIVKVVDGYCGITPMETLSAEEIFRIESWGTQERVMSKDSGNKYYSIPMFYRLLFQPLKQQGLTQQPISVLIKEYSLPLDVRLVSPPDCTLSLPNDLTLENVYTETFFKANSIVKGKLNSTCCIIPVYLDVDVVVAKRLRSGNETQWSQMMYNDETVTQYSMEKAMALSEINIYTLLEINRCEEMYERAKPDTYLTVGDAENEEAIYVNIPPPVSTSNIFKKTEAKRSSSLQVTQTKRASLPQRPQSDRRMTSSDNVYELERAFEKFKLTNTTNSKERNGVSGNTEAGSKIHNDLKVTQNNSESAEDNNHYENFSCTSDTSAGAKVRIKTAADIPQDISHLTVSQVGDCLKLLKMSEYDDTFAEHQVDGSLLKALGENILQEEFNMNPFKARKISHFATGAWRPRL